MKEVFKQIVPEEVLSEMWQFILKTSVVSELLEEKLKEGERERRMTVFPIDMHLNKKGFPLTE